MDRDNEIVVPISTAMRRLANVDTISGAKLLVKDPARVAETAREVRRLLRERHALAASQPDDFTIVTPVPGAADGGARAARLLRVPAARGRGLAARGRGRRREPDAVLGQRAHRRDRPAPSARRTAAGHRSAVPARDGAHDARRRRWAALSWAAPGRCSWRDAWGSRASSPGRRSCSASSLAAATGLLAGVLPARRASRLQPADALR